MKTTDEMLADLRAALAHHDQEATRLRAAIAALSGTAHAPAQQPIVLPFPVQFPTVNPLPGMYPVPAYPMPWTVQGHGGMCACQQCCPPTFCGTFETKAGMSLLLEAGWRVPIDCGGWHPPYMSVMPGLPPVGLHS